MKIYVAVTSKSTKDEPEYVARRERYSSGVTLSLDRAMRSKSEATLRQKVRKWFAEIDRDDADQVVIRELTASEHRDLEAKQKSAAWHRDYTSRRANVNVVLSEDEKTITLWVKKTRNKADRAFMAAMGIEWHTNEHGFSYVSIRNPMARGRS